MGKKSSKESDINDLLAVQQSDGSYIDKNNEITWYNEDGEHHKEDGPAIILPDDKLEWWLNDRSHAFNEWLELTPISDEQKMLLRLQYV
tara:strand:- start:33 stop:299 length:267 start_codon:yes stop_codon:yes gene_type:complete